MLGNRNGLLFNLKNESLRLPIRQFKMNNNSSEYTANYSDYLSNSNSQYYDKKYKDLKLKSNIDLSNNFINYNFNAKSNNLPVHYYHENYSDLLNKNNHSFISNQSGKRHFHRNSTVCSSMKDRLTHDAENVTITQRPIQKTEHLIANKTLVQFDLPASPAYLNLNWNSSQRNMSSNSQINDEQETHSLYNNSTLSPGSSSRQHSLVKRSSVLSSPTHINNNNNYSNDTKLPKLMPIYKDGRFSNPFDTWQERTTWGTLKFLLSPSNIGLPKNLKDLDVTLPVVKPILSSIIPDDQLRVTWIGM